MATGVVTGHAPKMGPVRLPYSLRRVAAEIFERRNGAPWNDHLRAAFQRELNLRTTHDREARELLSQLRGCLRKARELLEAAGLDPARSDPGKLLVASPGLGELGALFGEHDATLRALEKREPKRRVDITETALVVEVFGTVLIGALPTDAELEASITSRSEKAMLGGKPLVLGARIPTSAKVRRRGAGELAAISILVSSSNDIVDRAAGEALLAKRTGAIKALRVRRARGDR